MSASATPFRAVCVDARRLRLSAECELPLEADPATGRAVVRYAGERFSIRPWTFAERRRLLALAGAASGPPELARVVELAARGLVEPAPAEEHVEVLGLAALVWSAGAGAVPAEPTGVEAARVVVELAARTGWSPESIEGAHAADVDRWYAALRPAAANPSAATSSGDGFTRIELVED